MKKETRSSVVLLAALLIMAFVFTPGCSETEKGKPTSDPQTREANETLDDIIKNMDQLLTVIQGVTDGDSAQKAQAEVKELIGKINSLTRHRNTILQQRPELASNLFVAANASRMRKQIDQVVTQFKRLAALSGGNRAVLSILESLPQSSHNSFDSDRQGYLRQ